MNEPAGVGLFPDALLADATYLNLADEDVCSRFGATVGSSALMRCSLDGHG